MTRRIILFSTIWLICLALCSFRPEFEAEPLVAPLALDRTPDEIARRLRQFIPGRLCLDSVPGVSVAVVRNGKVIYREGFGVANTVTRRPVTPETVFEVASISKPVTAYAALQLVERGKLHLDEPLAPLLKEPYLEDPAGSAITLRQALTHTSGLSNQLDRKPTLVRLPGESFSYSGQGFLYAGRAIESVTGQTLDAYLESVVLPELDMKESGYVKKELSARMASPHISIIEPLWIFIVPAFSLYLLLSLLVWATARLIRRRGASQGWSTVALLVSIATGLAIPFLSGNANKAIRFALVNAAFLLLGLLLWKLITGHRGAEDGVSGSTPQGRSWSRHGTVLLCVLPLVYALVFRPPIPLQERPPGFPAAAGLRATASDVARFLSELIEPRHISKELVTEMQSEQVEVKHRIAWGLGIGIQKGDRYRAVWHWGINYPGFQALMVAYPAEKMGIAVLTNGGPISLTSGQIRYAGLELAREIAFQAIGGEHHGYWQGVQ